MKVKNISGGDTFKPIVLEISIESGVEAQKLYALFNNPYITSAYLVSRSGDNMRASIGREYADTRVYEDCLSELRRDL